MGLSNQVQVRRVSISPIDCYVQGKDFLGSEYGLFLGICIVGLILGGLVPIVLYGPAFCGMALCFLTRARGERVTFDLLFKGFDYFVPSLIATLIYMGSLVAIFIPLMVFFFIGVAMMAAQSAAMTVLAMLAMCSVYVVWILIIGVAGMVFMFAALLIVDKRLEGPAAMGLAFKGLTTNLMGVLLSATIGQVILLLGTMLCIVPGILLVPIVFAGHFVVYQKIYGVEMVKPVTAQMV